MLTKKEKVVKLLLLNGSFERSAKSLKSVAEEFSSVFKKKIRTKILEDCKGTIDELTQVHQNSIVDSYMVAFEENIIDDLITFYSSEAGRAMVHNELSQRDAAIDTFRVITQKLFKRINQAIANLEESGEISLQMPEDEDSFDDESSPFVTFSDDEDDDDDDEDTDVDDLINKY